MLPIRSLVLLLTMLSLVACEQTTNPPAKPKAESAKVQPAVQRTAAEAEPAAPVGSKPAPKISEPAPVAAAAQPKPPPRVVSPSPSRRINSGAAYTGSSASRWAARAALSSCWPSLRRSAAMPQRPLVPGISTPYTTASSTPGKAPRTFSASVVETFSPFQRKVSPRRSTNCACLQPISRIRSPVLNQASPFLNTLQNIAASLLAGSV